MEELPQDVPGDVPLGRISTLERILHHDAVAAVLLLAAAMAAFLMANLPIEVAGKTLQAWYDGLWHMELGFSFENRAVDQPLHLWINDGLMAIFFFVVGLEIKRELFIGELASIRKATLPIAAAIGGMVAPAGLFAILNLGGEGAVGWGIPMATDIAFSAGVLGLLAGRIPSALAVFLIALAIVDDLGSVLVIAVFYTESIDTRPLFVGLGTILTSLLLTRMGVRNALVFLVLAGIIWFEFLESGVHATIAGVLLAFTVPADARYETPHFVRRIEALLSHFHKVEDHVHPRFVNARQQRIIRAIESECIHVEAPLQRIENKLHLLTVAVIMPVFAFANAGVHVEFDKIGEVLLQPVTLGVIFGLVVGKQVGIMGCCAAVVWLKLAELPKGVTWGMLYGLSWLAGIGFTMSLFIGQLAFGGGHHGGDRGEAHPEPASHTVAAEAHVNDHAEHNGATHAEDAAHDGERATDHGEAHLTEAKVGTLIASIIAAIGGLAVLLSVTTKSEGSGRDNDAAAHA